MRSNLIEDKIQEVSESYNSIVLGDLSEVDDLINSYCKELNDINEKKKASLNDTKYNKVLTENRKRKRNVRKLFRQVNSELISIELHESTLAKHVNDNNDSVYDVDNFNVDIEVDIYIKKSEKLLLLIKKYSDNLKQFKLKKLTEENINTINNDTLTRTSTMSFENYQHSINNIVSQFNKLKPQFENSQYSNIKVKREKEREISVNYNSKLNQLENMKRMIESYSIKVNEKISEVGITHTDNMNDLSIYEVKDNEVNQDFAILDTLKNQIVNRIINLKAIQREEQNKRKESENNEFIENDKKTIIDGEEIRLDMEKLERALIEKKLKSNSTEELKLEDIDHREDIVKKCISVLSVYIMKNKSFIKKLIVVIISLVGIVYFWEYIIIILIIIFCIILVLSKK